MIQEFTSYQNTAFTLPTRARSSVHNDDVFVVVVSWQLDVNDVLLGVAHHHGEELPAQGLEFLRTHSTISQGLDPQAPGPLAEMDQR